MHQGDRRPGLHQGDRRPVHFLPLDFLHRMSVPLVQAKKFEHSSVFVIFRPFRKL